MNKQLADIVTYIIRFLLKDENVHLIGKIGYTSDENEYHKYDVIIKPSGFFDADRYGTAKTLPTLPLQEYNDIPVLFGGTNVERKNGQTITNADFIASAYFLLSRYEEMIRPHVRDQHGRFPGTESLPYRAGFLHRPVVDEYGEILQQLLGINEEKWHKNHSAIKKIYLTHDVDKLAHYRRMRGVIGALLRFPKHPIKSVNALKTFGGSIKSDPWFTFPWIFQKNERLIKKSVKTNVEQIAFIKSGGGKCSEDYPVERVNSKDFGQLLKLCKQKQVHIGLHPSYQAGINSRLIKTEKDKLQQLVDEKIVLVRHHYLTSREPEDFNYLINNGFTDDFTMGYADVSGFRLGTCRAVKWINPISCQLTELTLHPLTVMDNTLHEGKYMNLTLDEAKKYCSELIRQVQKYNGELVLLWHNTSVEKNNKQYHRELYAWVIDYLEKIIE